MIYKEFTMAVKNKKLKNYEYDRVVFYNVYLNRY